MAGSRKNRIGANPGRGQHGAKGAGQTEPGTVLDEFDLADRLKGDNDMKGLDQAQAPSERAAEPGSRDEPWDLLESFKKADKGYRARSDALDRDELKRKK